jgi:medium-chain acyl-[acyl-carrier-protein] hydrolase
MPKVAEKEFEVHCFDVDSRRKLSVPRLLNFFEDSALWQSEHLGIGIDYLKSNKLTWVLHQVNLHISRYPIYGDRVIVRTVPFTFMKFYAYRSYELFLTSGESMAISNSVWFLLDIERRKPIKVPEPIYKLYGVESMAATSIKLPKPSALSRDDYQMEFSVRQSEIDTNLHVNNARYIEWAIESVDLDIINCCSMKNLLILFQKEARYGMKIRAHTQIDRAEPEIRSFHRIVDASGSELCNVEMLWEKDR